MFSLNPSAPPFVPAAFKMPIFNDGQLSSIRVLNLEEYRMEILQEFDRDEVADEDLFNPAVYPVSEKDHEELAAAEAFNREMAELEDLEHHEELRLILQDRINALQHGIKQRPAKITSIHGGLSSMGHPRGSRSIVDLKGKHVMPLKRCVHNIDQPAQGGRYYS